MSSTSSAHEPPPPYAARLRQYVVVCGRVRWAARRLGSWSQRGLGMEGNKQANSARDSFWTSFFLGAASLRQRTKSTTGRRRGADAPRCREGSGHGRWAVLTHDCGFCRCATLSQGGPGSEKSRRLESWRAPVMNDQRLARCESRSSCDSGWRASGDRWAGEVRICGIRSLGASSSNVVLGCGTEAKKYY